MKRLYLMEVNDEKKSLLAAEYVLGTLQGLDRLRFQELISHDRHLQQHLSFWESHLTSFCEVLPTQEHRENLWQKIRSQINAKG